MLTSSDDGWRTEVRRLASAFLADDALPIETALALNALGGDDLPAATNGPFLTVQAVASETDAIPIGERRQLWHPDVRVAEDRKHDEAQAWARPLVEAACLQLLAELTLPVPDPGTPLP